MTNIILVVMLGYHLCHNDSEPNLRIMFFDEILENQDYSRLPPTNIT